MLVLVSKWQFVALCVKRTSLEPKLESSQEKEISRGQDEQLMFYTEKLRGTTSEEDSLLTTKRDHPREAVGSVVPYLQGRLEVV